MTRKEKSKAVEVGDGPAFTARQLKRIDRKVRERHERLRRKYKEIRGKKAEWVSHAIDDGWIYFTVRFMHTTALHLQVSPKLVLEGLELSDWTSGDDKVFRTYDRRKEES